MIGSWTFIKKAEFSGPCIKEEDDFSFHRPRKIKRTEWLYYSRNLESKKKR